MGDAYTAGADAVTGPDLIFFRMFNVRVPINDLRQGEDLIDLTTFAARRIGRFEAASGRPIE